MKKCLMLVWLVVVSIGVWAEEKQVADSALHLSLSLEEACKYAVEHNRNLQNASLSVRQAEAKRWQAIASMLPQVDASLSYANMFGYDMELSKGMKITMNPAGTFSLTASVALNGQMIMGALMSKLSIEMSDVAQKQTQQVIESSTVTVYVSILAVQQTLELLQQNYQNLQDLQAMQEKGVEVGAVEQVDADQIKVQVATLKNSLNEVQRNEQILYNSMRLLLGEGVDTQITLTQTLDQIINIESIMSLLGENLSLNDNYEYQLAKKQVELAGQNKTMAWMAYLPTLSAYYQYSAKTYFGKDAGFNTTVPNTVGLTLSVPIWSSGVRAAAISEKKRALESAENSLATTKDELEVSDRQYRYNLSTSYENYVVQKSNVEVSQRVYTNIANKYKYGYSSSLDLTNASTALVSAQSSYVSSITSMVTAYVNLKNLLNK